MANILSGKEVAQAITTQNILEVNNLKNKGIIPTVAIIRVGDNDADISYQKNAIKKCNDVSIEVKTFTLKENVDYNEFYFLLDSLNADNSINGILLLRPLPEYLDNEKARNYINPNKDIDGCSNYSLAGVFTNTNLGFPPCTAEAAIRILEHYNIDIKGKNIVVLGRSLVVGKPLSMMLLNKNATVTICHTKTVDIENITKNADIIICATGQMESINKNYIGSNQTIIDVGISWNNEKMKLCGDVLFEEVEPLVANITPVPGGVGTVTTSVLINHIIEATKRMNQ